MHSLLSILPEIISEYFRGKAWRRITINTFIVPTIDCCHAVTLMLNFLEKQKNEIK